MMKRVFLTVSVAAVLLVLSSSSAHAGTVQMHPAELNLALDDGAAGGADEGRLSVRLHDFPKIWGVEFYVTFDATKVEVMSVDPGVCPAPEIKIHQDVSKVGGADVVRYTMSALSSGPCSAQGRSEGVEAFSIRFHRIAPGDARIDFSLAKPAGVSIVTDANIAVCDNKTPLCWQGALITAEKVDSAAVTD